MKEFYPRLLEKFSEKGDPVENMGIGLKKRFFELNDLLEDMIHNLNIRVENLDRDEEELTIRTDSREEVDLRNVNDRIREGDWQELGVWEPFELEYYLDFILRKNVLYRSIHLSNQDLPEFDYWKERILCNDVVGTSDDDLSEMIVDDYESVDDSMEFDDGLQEAWAIAQDMLKKPIKKIR